MTSSTPKRCVPLLLDWCFFDPINAVRFIHPVTYPKNRLMSCLHDSTAVSQDSAVELVVKPDQCWNEGFIDRNSINEDYVSSDKAKIIQGAYPDQKHHRTVFWERRMRWKKIASQATIAAKTLLMIWLFVKQHHSKQSRPTLC